MLVTDLGGRFSNHANNAFDSPKIASKKLFRIQQKRPCSPPPTWHD